MFPPRSGSESDLGCTNSELVDEFHHWLGVRCYELLCGVAHHIVPVPCLEICLTVCPTVGTLRFVLPTLPLANRECPVPPDTTEEDVVFCGELADICAVPTILVPTGIVQMLDEGFERYQQVCVRRMIQIFEAPEYPVDLAITPWLHSVEEVHESCEWITPRILLDLEQASFE